MSCFKERFVFCGAMAMASLTVAAIEYQWVPGATDWTDPASYTNTAVAEVNKSVPGAGDVVAIPENCTVTLDCNNSDAVTAANNIGRIRPMTSSSHLVVTVPEGETVTLSAKVNYESDNSKAGNNIGKGRVFKKGLGTLILGSGSGINDYYTSWVVEKGTLQLPRDTNGSWRYYDIVAVSNGATLALCENSDKTKSALFGPQGLIGEGLVTNFNTSSGVGVIEVLGRGNSWSHRYDGIIAGKIMVCNPRTRFDLTNSNNTFSGGIRAVRETAYSTYGESVIGLVKIGNKADAASSAGKYDTAYGLGYRDTRAWNRHYGAGFMYLGTGERTDKDIYVNASNYNTDKLQSDPNFFDGGPNGGLTLAGEFKIYDAYNQVFVLTGSNANECVVAGPLKRKTGSDGTNYNWRIIKRGTGAWRFTDVANTEMEGVFAVENGSLRYDSIAEAGTRCALGYSTQLLENGIGKIDDLRPVDYAFELGSTTDAAADPIFEYTGATKGWCFSRPIALKGNARLRNSGGELRLANLKTLNDTPKTLTLDGNGDNAWIFNVLDPYGTLSLVKDGAGTWTIAGTNQISGSIVVKGGTLNLRTGYSWFKWTHKQTAGDWQMCNIELGIYDKDGSRVNSGLSYNSTRYTGMESAKNINAGDVALLGAGTYNGTVSDVSKMFDNDIATEWLTAHYPYGEATWRQAKANDPTSWFGVVMRLPDDAPVATSYDLIGWGIWSYKSNMVSKAFMLEGSFDGVNWDVVHDFEGQGNLGGLATRWRFGGETYGNGNAACPPSALSSHATGQPIAGYPEGLAKWFANVTEISVATGACLMATGEIADLPSGIRLTVDGATGAGTFANMVFPESGTLEIVNAAPISDALELTITRENVSGFENVANWNLVINGLPVPSGRIKCRTASDKIVLYRPGTIFTLR